MESQGPQYSYIKLNFLLFCLIPCLGPVSRALSATPTDAPDPNNPCTLVFDCNDVSSAEIMIPDNWRTRQVYRCRDGKIILPAGTFEITTISFHSGVSISYKNKIIEMSPEKETVITFTLPTESNLTIRKQGIYIIPQYTPKGFPDEEFYCNYKSPPVFSFYKGKRLLHSHTTEYG